MYAAGFLSSFYKTYDYKASGVVGSALAEEVVQINGAQLSKNRIREIRAKFFEGYLFLTLKLNLFIRYFLHQHK